MAKGRQNMAILGSKKWKILHRKTRKKGLKVGKTWQFQENIAENDRKEGIRTRQGFGELKKYPCDHIFQ